MADRLMVVFFAKMGLDRDPDMQSDILVVHLSSRRRLNPSKCKDGKNLRQAGAPNWIQKIPAELLQYHQAQAYHF